MAYNNVIEEFYMFMDAFRVD